VTWQFLSHLLFSQHLHELMQLLCHRKVVR
jgi:hypothetical protein